MKWALPRYCSLLRVATLCFLASAMLCAGCEKPVQPDVEAAAAVESAAAASHAAGECEHHLPAALCPRCQPALAAVYQARGDWCDEHGFPESFCPICNPDAVIPDVDAPASASDWCGGHALPESQCTKCNPSLIPRFRAAGDYCEEHGFPESVCPICNPQTPPAGPVSDWCVEHGLPESSCTLCNPSLIPRFQAAGDYCEEHGFPESLCPVCNPQPPPPGAERASIEARVVRFRTPEIESAAGIETAVAIAAEASVSIECTGRIAFHGDRIAEVRAIVPGIVRGVRVALGEQVDAGTRLFDLESTQVGQTQGILIAARQRVQTAELHVARQRELRARDIASVRQVEIAEQELSAAQTDVRTATATLRMAGAGRSGPSGRYSLSAPIGGTVVRRPAVIGRLATESESLATIADTSVMWAMCDIPEADAPRIALGQRVTLSVDGHAGETVGEITWISTEVDPRSRTVTTRAEVPNPDGSLRANQFAQARVQTGAPRSAVTVPRSAVQRVDHLEVLFVRTSPGVFEPRVVERHGGGETVQVLGRVRVGDAVVTTGAVLLRTEIMPGSIGAGCCEPGSAD